MKLFEFTTEDHPEHGKQDRRRPRIGRRCVRCASGILRSEDEIYWRSGLCGWCFYMYQKMLRE